jgi:hypothetical protein
MPVLANVDDEALGVTRARVTQLVSLLLLVPEE